MTSLKLEPKSEGHHDPCHPYDTGNSLSWNSDHMSLCRHYCLTNNENIRELERIIYFKVFTGVWIESVAVLGTAGPGPEIICGALV